jgi:hypothetical protein
MARGCATNSNAPSRCQLGVPERQIFSGDLAPSHSEPL